MVNERKLTRILENYKAQFENWWKEEKFKWVAIRHFQDNWDIDAPDFKDMFEKATEKADNLLTSRMYFPRGMIFEFARVDEDATRNMFISLFDENRDLASRIDDFAKSAIAIRNKYGADKWKNDFQDSRAISTYLWLRYPDKYYIYKLSELLKVSRELDYSFISKRGQVAANLIEGYKLYDDICEQISKDDELVNKLRASLTDDCHPDKNLKTLTIDLSYFISHMKSENEDINSNEWFPSNYSPNISKEEWLGLLQDRDIFNDVSLKIMKRMIDFGGTATCKQLHDKYGEPINLYNAGSVALAKRVAERTNCPVMESNNENSKWWPILYTGKRADNSVDGSYAWRLRDELIDALNMYDMSGIPLYANNAPVIWKISHGTDYFSDTENRKLEYSKVVVVNGNTNSVGTSKISQGDSFLSEMKKGDVFYLCYGSIVRLLGRVESDNATPCEYKDGTWYQRAYSIIAESISDLPYKEEKKWWTPNFNSTCVNVPEEEKERFEQLLLKPYFNMTIDMVTKQFAGESFPSNRNYWWLNANPSIWSFLGMQVGETQAYSYNNENGNRRRIYRNFVDAKVGDLIIGYVSQPIKQIVALAEVVSNDGQYLRFKKTEGFSNPINYSTLHGFEELSSMEYFRNPQGSLFKLTKDEYDFIIGIIRENNPNEMGVTLVEYSKQDFLEEVYLSSDDYDTLVQLLRRKKNLIIQGAPGVGKTFAAKRLAYSLMKVKDDSRIEFVQFHQNYSYEDFVMGYRPCDIGFELQYGIFYKFCQKAANTPMEDFFFIIDEINRGNISKILGELLMLIEKEYRGTKATLAYNGMQFAVPENLYIIGLMNTADRSLAMIDYALRRRFSFFEIEPGFDSEGFRAYQKRLNNSKLDTLVSRIIELNKEIAIDVTLGAGFRIGHSYLCGQEVCNDEWMRQVVDCDLIPILREYWFDDADKVRQWEGLLEIKND